MAAHTYSITVKTECFTDITDPLLTNLLFRWLLIINRIVGYLTVI